MVMRYHWGLAIGHTYAHEPQPAPHSGESLATHKRNRLEDEEQEPEYEELPQDLADFVGDDNESNPEFGMENREDCWVDVEDSDCDDDNGGPFDAEDAEEVAMYGMYGESRDFMDDYE